MPVVNSLWYYSSAKPEAGYTAAVKGYAHKLAEELAYEVIALESSDHEYLQQLAEEKGTPQYVIGAGEQVNWPSAAPQILKARPYADQHGNGPSMHALTRERLEHAQARALAQWGMLAAPVMTLCIANPMWLVGAEEEWAAKIVEWAQKGQVLTLMVTNSPRTNPLVWQPFKEALSADIQLICNDCREGDNRYQEMLAVADAITILGSSRSMAGEAALTGCPVYYKADESEAEQRFFADAEALMGEGAKRYHPLDMQQEPLIGEHYEPINVTSRYVGQTIRELGITKAA